METFDESKYYLGNLCKRGHDWNGTGKSLRNKKNRDCNECHVAQHAKWREENRKQCQEYDKKRWKEQHLTERYKMYRRKVNKTYQDKHKEQHRLWDITHYQNKINRLQVTGIDTVCPVCGSIFKLAAYKLKDGSNAHYCSRQCRIESTKRQVTINRNCVVCGVEFTKVVKLSFYEDKRHPLNYCSRKCFDARGSMDKVERLKSNRIRNKMQCKTLHDVYVKSLLCRIPSAHGINSIDIPPYLVELKRIQLKAYRAARDYKKGVRNAEHNTDSKTHGGDCGQGNREVGKGGNIPSESRCSKQSPEHVCKGEC